jgi:hypothetical protein
VLMLLLQVGHLDQDISASNHVLTLKMLLECPEHEEEAANSVQSAAGLPNRCNPRGLVTCVQVFESRSKHSACSMLPSVFIQKLC